jgi:membrane-associated phospholipid phosphatase
VHYAGDILAGWLLGVAIAIGVDLLWSKEEQV